MINTPNSATVGANNGWQDNPIRCNVPANIKTPVVNKTSEFIMTVARFFISISLLFKRLRP